ncbi:MAG: hypothetical protein A2787_04445 [Omnitrophica WOR_2 bacterium RIFCSPHIGHO2_01_FULL_48_9]|nr:MAG: hypothetical protein A3D10_09260 [Omnitrophica WOR_2 bacterium RIFCSPHIGHO2_02_FULL_48_11]OGX30047.1 MAG: hypothetical protein A2787_04445 [Omnitrophica WOR_2 bacterium RIFCSPHIGHO2_01_FULL_48_9]
MAIQEIKIGFGDILRSSGLWRIKSVKFMDYAFSSLLAFLVSEKRGRALESSTVRDILIIRPGGIGDAIFLLPFLSFLKKTMPHVKIDILAEKRNAAIFSSQKSLCDKIYCYDAPGQFYKIFRKSYDAVLDTEQWHYASALVAYFCKSPVTVGFATRPLRTKLFSTPIPYEANAYEIENFKKLFTVLCPAVSQVNNINACYTLSQDSIAWAQKKLPENSVTVFLGASIPERRLTKSQSTELIRKILEKGFCPILLGGTDVSAIGLELEEEISDKHLKNFIGKVSLEQSAALIQRSRLFIGTDSGLLHLACAVGTSTVAIFGPGNLKKWAPQGPKHTIITENVECSPCTRFGYTVPTCEGSYHCMREIKMEFMKKLL